MRSLGCAVVKFSGRVSGLHLAATLMFEYRRSNYEKAASSTVQDEVDEASAKLAFEF
ncbi:MAG: hypothetical protein JXB42_09575 [Deltaproteobacteria bacterium]|nr:hypothetical protein [Deltaproteobacteria bacterium]